jgi:D-glycero-D-manno-heptose 1,7-bisphosphate phosphatase
MKRAAFLDRDGVLNRAVVLNGIPTPPKNLTDVVILPGVREAILLIKESEYEIVVVTNQPDVARGTQTQTSVQEINGFLQMELGITHFYICFHDDLDSCGCRKPMPGLLLLAASELNLDLQQSYMVGDRWRDIAAGQAAKCRCFYINNGYAEKSPNLPFTEVSSLIEVARIMT